MKRVLIALILIAAAAGGLWMLTHRKAGDGAPAKPGGTRGGPVPVTVADVTVRAVPLERRTFGTVEPAATVTLRSQVSGTLSNACFAEGQSVAANDLLFVIDTRPLEAALQQAEAARARNAAQLANAEKEARRQDELFKAGIASEDTRDQARTAADSLRAQVQSDEAAVVNARLQLDDAYIRAPVSGRMGALQLHAGNLVKANDTPLAVLNQVKPVLVRFSLPQQDLPLVRERMAAATLPVLATGADPAATVRTGALVFVDNAIDQATGTIAMKARFANDDEALWPGQYVTVALQLAVQDKAMVVPSRAILPGQHGDYVYIVGPDASVSNRPVRVDRTYGETAVIAAGLQPGDRVVTDGQLRLAPGARIAASEGERARTP